MRLVIYVELKMKWGLGNPLIEQVYALFVFLGRGGLPADLARHHASKYASCKREDVENVKVCPPEFPLKALETR